jgi:uncharacterized protein with HEPN domain
MDTRAAKELLHIAAWLEGIDAIVARGRRSYHDDDLLQEAGDSLMMKMGEAAGRLSRLSVLAPDGIEWALAVANRNFIIHQYDEMNRETTWLTLARDLPVWRASPRPRPGSRRYHYRQRLTRRTGNRPQANGARPQVARPLALVRHAVR